MLTDIQLEKYANVLFWGMQKARTTPFVPGGIVLVRTDIAALPLAEKVQAVVLAHGLHPVVRIMPASGLEKGFYNGAGQDQLAFTVPGDKELYERLDGLISLLAPDSITHLRSIAPEKIATVAVARKYLRDILDSKEARMQFGWTLCLMPTPALAQAAGMTQDAYAEQIVRAAYLDADDPVAEWERIFHNAQGVKDWLNSMDVEYYHVRSASTDLRIYPGEQRKWIGVSGHNIPSFELFLSPDFRHTQGIYHADQPSYRNGNLVSGVTLEFTDGQARVVKADQGEAFVRTQLEMDPGACRLGEFSLTDKRFSQINAFMAHTLFDENFGGEHGNCHVAVGASYADTYDGDPAELVGERKKELGFNDSALHWDLVNTEPKTVTAVCKDGQAVEIYSQGVFLH
ncbi:aminopeptidase [Desulfovibrionales bacterium]